MGATISNLGAEAELVLARRRRLEMVVTLRDGPLESDPPLDLTGCEATLQVRDGATPESRLLLEVDGEMVGDPTDGVVSFVKARADMARLKLGSGFRWEAVVLATADGPAVDTELDGRSLLGGPCSITESVVDV